jgi:hypothetical protein
MSSKYIGVTPDRFFDGFERKFLYGLRRNDDGEVFLIKINQAAPEEDNSIVINDTGPVEENFPDFEEGIDFLSGVDEDRNVVYDNLRYTQIKWDNRSMTFYIEPDSGQFVQRVSKGFQHPDGISTPGYSEGQDQNVLANTDFTDAERE